jgi:DNA-binding GntR family transcriptional regulator
MERGFRAGARLDPAVLAEELNSSTTPVREAIERLVGEDLVESRTGSGFYMPALDEPGLEDMYAWSSQVLALAVRNWGKQQGGAEARSGDETAHQEETLAARTARTFAEIAARSDNGEHVRALRSVNARLQAIRIIEPLVLDDGDSELAAIETARAVDDRPGLRRFLGGYHRRRVRAGGAILRAHYRAP